jgi:hypothetical protein
VESDVQGGNHVIDLSSLDEIASDRIPALRARHAAAQGMRRHWDT